MGREAGCGEWALAAARPQDGAYCTPAQGRCLRLRRNGWLCRVLAKRRACVDALAASAAAGRSVCRQPAQAEHANAKAAGPYRRPAAGWCLFTAALQVLQRLRSYQQMPALLRQQHLVDHMDHAIRLVHIGDGDGGGTAFLVGQRDLAALGLGDQGAAADGLDAGHAAAVLDHLADRGGIPLAGDDVVGQHGSQRALVLGLEQVVYGAGGQGRKGSIGGGKHGEGAGALEGVDQAGCLDGCDQGGVVLGVDGVVDDVLGGQHGRAAHHHVFGGRRHGCACDHECHAIRDQFARTLDRGHEMLLACG